LGNLQVVQDIRIWQKVTAFLQLLQIAIVKKPKLVFKHLKKFIP